MRRQPRTASLGGNAGTDLHLGDVDTDDALYSEDHDVLIARPDLCPGAATFIRAGDPIPLELLNNEREPA